MSARDCMVFKPEDLTTEEIHYELLLRHEIIDKQSNRQLTATLNRMLTEEPQAKKRHSVICIMSVSKDYYKTWNRL